MSAITMPASWRCRPNTWDWNIFDAVVVHDEYRVPELRADDIVLDVGAHIGSFSYLAYQRGARRIYAFEPERENYQLLQDNVGRYGITCVNRAVWKSVFKPGEARSLFYRKSLNNKNTGGGDIFGAFGAPVDSVGLDYVIRNAAGDGRVRLLKLDCEGSEYEILRTSRRLPQVDEICGEYHPRPEEALEDFRAYLEGAGFTTALTPTLEGLGHFRAVRRKTTGAKLKLGVVTPVWLQNQATLDMTLATAALVRSELVDATHYYVTTRLHICSAKELQEKLQAVSPAPVKVIHDPGVAKSVARAWNDGCRTALNDGSRYLCILANDVFLEPDCLDRMLAFGESSASAGIAMWSGVHSEKDKPQSEEITDGCDYSCAMFRPQTIGKFGWFDERFSPAYFDDNDYFARIALGGEESRYVHAARFFHPGSQTIKLDADANYHCAYWFEANRRRFERKWGVSQPEGTTAGVREKYYKTPWNEPGLRVGAWDRD